MFKEWFQQLFPEWLGLPMYLVSASVLGFVALFVIVLVLKIVISRMNKDRKNAV